MSIHKYFERVRFIDYLIHKRATGNIDSLAGKLNLSRSMAYHFLKEMREEGFPIAYSKKRKSYYYTEEGKMVDHLYTKDIKWLSPDEMKMVTGGHNFSKLFFRPGSTVQ